MWTSLDSEFVSSNGSGCSFRETLSWFGSNFLLFSTTSSCSSSVTHVKWANSLKKTIKKTEKRCIWWKFSHHKNFLTKNALINRPKNGSTTWTELLFSMLSIDATSIFRLVFNNTLWAGNWKRHLIKASISTRRLNIVRIGLHFMGRERERERERESRWPWRLLWPESRKVFTQFLFILLVDQFILAYNSSKWGERSKRLREMWESLTFTSFKYEKLVEYFA